MHHDFIDRYSRLDSPIHRLGAGWKLGSALVAVLAFVSVPLHVPAFFVAGALALVAIAAASRVPWRFLAQRLLLLEPFVAGIAILSALQPNGRALALSILVRSTLCLATMILLTNTTPFQALLGALRRAGLPPLLATVLALMYRYLFVLIDEAGRMQRARASRTFVERRGQAWRGSAVLAGQLFLRSTERAERIYSAMCARGWR